MTPEQAAHIMEPLWIGLEASLERLADATEALCQTPGESTVRELAEFYQAQDFLLAMGRRLDAHHLDVTALELGNGKVVFWPCLVNFQHQRDAIARWLSKNPKIKAKREARAEAWRERLERAARDVRKVVPLTQATAAPVEPLAVAGGAS